ncbi:MAG: hypothetical protein ISR72_13985 [Methylobacter sp.]|nr:hypothetical protein [Methylobacter sp.]
MTENPLELAEVIQTLRENLAEAQSRGEGHNIRFNVNSVEVELQTVIEKEAGAGGKIKFWVVDGELSGKYKKSATHKIKLSLQAVDMDPKTKQTKNVLLSDDE